MWELVKTTCLLHKGQEFSSKWSSEADLELHFSGLDLNIRLVVCMAACLWRPRSVTEQYCKFLKTRRDLNDIWNDIWTTSERHPNSSQVIIDPFDPSCYPFLTWIWKKKERRQEYMSFALLALRIHSFGGNIQRANLEVLYPFQDHILRELSFT